MPFFHQRSLIRVVVEVAVVLGLVCLHLLPPPSRTKTLSVAWNVEAFSQSPLRTPTVTNGVPARKQIQLMTDKLLVCPQGWWLLRNNADADFHTNYNIRRSLQLFVSAAGNSNNLALPIIESDEGQGEEDEMEWVEEEFELLTERDFYNTEWKVGTLMDNKPRDAKSIDTTWVRLVTTESGENEAIWGDGSKGKWTIDVPSQFFSISKESFGGWLGKKIWAGTINDFYYLDGTVRGWGPISPASVVGQWQAMRLGVVDGERVTAEERGVAPWFMKDDDDNDEDDDMNSKLEIAEESEL